MGLFSRVPAEQKAYEKALKGLVSKVNEKTIAEMETASKNYPQGWQGYLYLALCYDMASHKLPFDPDKAKHYHNLARKAAAVADSDAATMFYGYYDMPGENYRVPEKLYPRAIQIRKAIVGMAVSLELDNLSLFYPSSMLSNDLDYWSSLFSGVDTGGLFKSNEEQDQCSRLTTQVFDYINVCRVKDDKDDEFNRCFNEMVNANNATLKQYKKPEDFDENMCDLRLFLFGWGCLVDGPFERIAGLGSWPRDLQQSGWRFVRSAAILGCIPAVYCMASMFNNDSDTASKITAALSEDDVEKARADLKAYLNRCAKVAPIETQEYFDNL